MTDAQKIAAHDALVDALRAAEFVETLRISDAGQIIRACEALGDYESAGLSRDKVIANYQAKAAELRRAALSLATEGK